MKIWLQVSYVDNVKVEIKEGKSLLYKSNSIPFGVIPGNVDGLQLLIDVDSGRIMNWQTCSEMVRKFIEDQAKENKK